MGFFNKVDDRNDPEVQAEIKKRKSVHKNIPIRVLAHRDPYKKGCAACPLNKEEDNLQHPKMEPTGAKRPLIYILGEAPGKNEDEQGEQFVGNSGQLIREHIPEELERKIRWSNTVQCRPPGNRTPTDVEIACCSQRVEADIERTKPALIIGFGVTPLKWAINEGIISDWRGDLLPVQIGSHKCWYAPIWHPAFIARKRNDKKDGDQFWETYLNDLDRAFFYASEGLEPPWIPEGEELSAGMHWELSWKVDRVAEFLESMRKAAPKNQAVDIETNMLRPYRKDSKILTIAFGTWDLSYSIPISHSEAKWTDKQRKQVWELIGEHMRTPGIRFWAHSLKFETEWLSMPFALGRSILYEVKWGDTMAQAHVLSSKNLHGLSLNSRCKALFGVAEKALDDMNLDTLDQAPIANVLRYNARDVKFTDPVRRMQTKLLREEGLREAYQIVVSRVPSLTIAQQNGVRPNPKVALTMHEELAKKIEAVEKKIQKIPEVMELVAETGKPFNSNSANQLKVILLDKLQLKQGWRVEKGVKKYSTDQEVLERISHPIAKLILEKRELVKLDSTYVIGFCPKGNTNKDFGKHIWDDGLIHTVYEYLKTSTGRLSSVDPNLQNIPVRQHREIRAAVVEAFGGYILVSVDYGQIEARVIAMASLCPVLVKALWEHYDIHGAWTDIIIQKHRKVFDKYLRASKGDDKKAWKAFRSDIKNQWTFPLFFGSVLGSVAAALEIRPDDLEPQFNQFWKMFAAVRKWQKKVDEFYRQHGYVETLTKRRRYGPLSFNEQINSPIQGTACDIVMDAMNRLALKSYEEDRPQLAARMQIHDDLTFLLPKKTLEVDMPDIIEVMVTPQFDFINVPITAEIKMGPNWADMEEVETIESTDYGFPERR